jgi:hypothetical protein
MKAGDFNFPFFKDHYQIPHAAILNGHFPWAATRPAIPYDAEPSNYGSIAAVSGAPEFCRSIRREMNPWPERTCLLVPVIQAMEHGAFPGATCSCSIAWWRRGA